MQYYNKLVCPYCIGNLSVGGDKLYCETCNKAFPIKNGIPIFLETVSNYTAYSKWYPVIFKTKEPLPPVTYYSKFSRDWERMLDLGCGDGVMSMDSASRVGEIFCVDPCFEALLHVSQ
ncbi:hypothetical protein ES703_58540 [subsurface metagenome]